MTQEHALSKQTKDELIKLFTKPVIWHGSEIRRISEDEAKKLVSHVDKIVTMDLNPMDGSIFDYFSCKPLPLALRSLSPLQRTQCLLPSLTPMILRSDDYYKKAITNKTEAEQVDRAVQVITNAFIAVIAPKH